MLYNRGGQTASHEYKGLDHKRNLKKHLIYACGVNSQLQCILYLKKFARKHTLKVHSISVHKLL